MAININTIEIVTGKAPDNKNNNINIYYNNANICYAKKKKLKDDSAHIQR